MEMKMMEIVRAHRERSYSYEPWRCEAGVLRLFGIAMYTHPEMMVQCLEGSEKDVFRID